MIYYRPTDGDPLSAPLRWKVRTAFIMQQLGRPLPIELRQTRSTVERILGQLKFSCVDATSRTTGRDFLLKVWQTAASCPIGVAIVQEGIAAATLANIYYELGLMQAYGRETVVVRIGAPALPSDLVRTEYIDADENLKAHLTSMVDDFTERAEYYEFMADQLENNPLLSIDYLRRAYLLSGRESLRERAGELFERYDLRRRAKSSVERILVSF